MQEPHKGKVDLSAILNNPYAGKGKVTFDPKAVYNFNLEKTLDEKVLVKKCAPAIQKGEKVSVDVNVTNTDRAFGTILGSENCKLYRCRRTELRCLYSERTDIETDR